MNEKLPNHSLSHLPKLRAFMRTWGWLSAAAVAAVFCLSALALLTVYKLNVYVPDAEQLLRPGSASRTFIVDHTEVNGVYGNNDVDSVVFTYITELEESAFWKALDWFAKRDGWKLRKSRPSHRRYLRVIPKTGRDVFHSVAEVRVAYWPAHRTVVVAWVRADTSKLPDQLPTGAQGAFAEEIVWPKFDALVAEQR
ncbi:MAG: hypothetical protein WD894_04145 [Pirellulales bacterium]